MRSDSCKIRLMRPRKACLSPSGTIRGVPSNSSGRGRSPETVFLQGWWTSVSSPHILAWHPCRVVRSFSGRPGGPSSGRRNGDVKLSKRSGRGRFRVFRGFDSTACTVQQEEAGPVRYLSSFGNEDDDVSSSGRCTGAALFVGGDSQISAWPGGWHHLPWAR